MSTLTKIEAYDFAKTVVPPGLSLLGASAGTGKTFNLTHQAAAFLLDGTVERLSEILIVTFTNDAAREILDRIRSVIGKLGDAPADDEVSKDPGIAKLRAKASEDPASRRRLAKAVLEIDQLQVSTLHSFCQRTLQMEGTLCGMASMPELITDDQALLEEALRDLWQARLARDPWLAAAALSRKWSLEKDLETIRAARVLNDPTWEPRPEKLEDMLRDLQDKVRAIAEPAALSEARTLARAVPKWKEQLSQDAALAIIDALALLDPDNPAEAFPAITACAELPELAGAAGKAAKTAKDAFSSCVLSRNCSAAVVALKGLQWSWQHFCAQEVGIKVDEALRTNRQITQDGLIKTLHQALHAGELGEALARRLAERYKVAMIDESQDTDPWQFDIFRRIFLRSDLERRLILIGDPKQAIYGFRGADLETFLRASEQAGVSYSLTRTYRAPAPLVQTVNNLYKGRHSLLHEQLDFTEASSGVKEPCSLLLPDEGENLRLRAWIEPDAGNNRFSTSNKRTRNIAGCVATEIVRLLSTGRIRIHKESGAHEDRAVSPGDFAVLVQAHYQGEQIAEALRIRGVPAIVTSGEDVMSSDEAAEILVLLRAVNESRRGALRRAALCTRMLGHNTSDLCAIAKDAALEEDWLRRFEDWGKLWLKEGVSSMLAAIDLQQGITLRLSKTPEGERRVTNLRHLSDLLQRESSSGDANPERLIRWVGSEITRAKGSKAIEERQLQLESDSHAVQIVTMHKAKGLEYNLVFCPYLWVARESEGVQSLRARRAGAKDILADRSNAAPETLSALRRSAMEERLRISYVALTRARIALWVLGGDIARNTRKAEGASALDWLLREESVSSADFPAWQDSAVIGRGERHARRLTALFAKDSGLINVSPPPAMNFERWEKGEDQASPLRAQPAPAVAQPWSLTSFSSLAHDTEHRVAASARKTSDSSPEQLKANSFLPAVAGPEVGTAVHELLEDWDFDEIDARLVALHLKRAGVPPAAEGQVSTEEAVAGMLPHLRDAMLPGLGLRLAECCRSKRACEWHFHLPLKADFGVRQLAEVFRRHAQPELSGYAAMLENLNQNKLTGFLHGFIDRIALAGSSWGVMDWKTNRLGQSPGDYDHEGLLTCAMENHYVLQMHLYLVALRRYLALRKTPPPLAGAWLVFLRAVEERTDKGILHINPSFEMLKELDGLFADTRRA